MSETIVLTKLDERANGIIDRFQSRTGLDDAEDHEDRRVFRISGSDHGIDVVRTLTAIDEHWPRHVGFQHPA